jgi:acyl transferase domain-containing protein/SAM-dependent methyltransferase/acyl carrier protein
MSELAPSDSTSSPVKRALLEIRRLRAILAERQSRQADRIAVIGMAVRFPGGISRLDDFWTMLASGEHGVTEVPIDRWDGAALYDAGADTPGKTYSRHGGFVSDIDRFDAAFFGITPREAESMDPQHRLLLEVTWEALEHAGIPPTSLSGTQTGVFVGLSNSDYGRELLAQRDDVDAYSGFGLALSIAAGRISYFLNAKGPSLVVDTACSSSLSALHLARQSLITGESSLGVVGGVNLMLAPEVTMSFSHARMLSPDGQCKTFDADANGYVRGEGCAVVVLKRLADAEADGDRILAVIRGSAVNHDGRSAGLTAPNGPAQTAVIGRALNDAGLTPADVDYVEAHGTGTPLGDPIELQALGAAYGLGRPKDRPLRIGSVKTNLGHLESAAGLAGLVKIVLSLQQEALPPHRNFSRPNPRVDWGSLPVSVVREMTPWPRAALPRRAGVSAFGFSGTNVHVVLEEAPSRPARPAETQSDPACLFVLSARSPAALLALARDYAAWLLHNDESLSDICYSAATGRSHHRYRLAAIVSDRAGLARALKAWCDGVADSGVRSATAQQPAPQIGAFYPALSDAEIRANSDVLSSMSADFADAIAEFSELVELANTGSARAVAFQSALSRLWNALGVIPMAAFGVGSGAFAAAAAAGVLAPREALERLRGCQNLPPPATSAIAFISATTGRVEARWSDGFADPASSVRLEEAARAAKAAGAEQFLVFGTEASSAPATIERRASTLSRTEAAAWSSVLEAAQILYLGGADLAWGALYRSPGQARSRQKLDLPFYAFQRERFWRSTKALKQTERSVSTIPDWRKLRSTVALQSDAGPLGWDVSTYEARWRAADQLTAGCAINALAAFGAFRRAGEKATADDLIRCFGVVPQYRNLMRRWLRLLEREGHLHEESGAFVSPVAFSARDLTEPWRAAERLMSDDPDMLAYVRRTSARLADLLTGRVNPLEVLFARGSLDMAEGIYERNPTASYLNAIVAAAVRSTLEDHRGGAPFRLVEAGGGTGGTTSRLAGFFPSDGEYWFTDLSDTFLSRARRRFGENPAFRFLPFDLEKPPPADLPLGRADVVLAANVVHATRDVGVALDHLRSLLAPGGLLVLIESTMHHSLLDLSIAFVEGWNRFDDAYRAGHPLLTADRWTSLLTERGFLEAERFPKAGAAADNIGQHVLIGRNSLEARNPGQRATASALGFVAAVATARATAQSEDRPTPVDGSAKVVARGDIERVVRDCCARVMHLDSTNRLGPRERFSDLGMDSLMAIQLQTDLADALGLVERLPVTIAFDTGTVEALTDEIVRLSGPAQTQTEKLDLSSYPRGERPSAAPGVISAAELETLSEQEVETLLAERIAIHPETVKQ